MFVSQALLSYMESSLWGVLINAPHPALFPCGERDKRARARKTPALQTALLSRLLLDGFLDGLLRCLLDGLLLLSGQSTSPPSSGTKRYSRTTHFQRGEPGLHRTPALTSYETKKK